PKQFLEELSGLQDKVEPIPVEQIKTIIEAQLNDSIEKLFTNFDEQPLASASIAQVHKATLLSGEEVVLKVLKPNLKKQLKVDIHILENFANLLANRTTWARNIDIINLTEGFIQNLHEEVDFTIELKNTKEMKNIEDSKVYIPEIYSALSTSDILVIEYLDGVSINKIDDIVTGK